MSLRQIACLRVHALDGRDPRPALLALQQATRQEPGCLSFAFYQSLEDPADWVLLESFADAAALQSHMAQPHTRQFFALCEVSGLTVHPWPAAD